MLLRTCELLVCCNLWLLNEYCRLYKSVILKAFDRNLIDLTRKITSLMSSGKITNGFCNHLSSCSVCTYLLIAGFIQLSLYLWLDMASIVYCKTTFENGLKKCKSVSLLLYEYLKKKIYVINPTFYRLY